MGLELFVTKVMFGSSVGSGDAADVQNHLGLAISILMCRINYSFDCVTIASSMAVYSHIPTW